MVVSPHLALRLVLVLLASPSPSLISASALPRHRAPAQVQDAQTQAQDISAFSFYRNKVPPSDFAPDYHPPANAFIQLSPFPSSSPSAPSLDKRKGKKADGDDDDYYYDDEDDDQMADESPSDQGSEDDGVVEDDDAKIKKTSTGAHDDDDGHATDDGQLDDDSGSSTTTTTSFYATKQPQSGHDDGDESEPPSPSTSTSTSTGTTKLFEAPLPASKVKSGTQCDILRNIYSDMGGDSWIIKDGWVVQQQQPSTATATSTGPSPSSSANSQTHCCSWYGVTCDGTSVSALDLAANGLSGSFSARIFSLPALERLNLSNNALAGPVPDMFHSLPELKNLDLGTNTFSGPIPPTLLTHAQLSTVHLSANQLSGMANFTAPVLVNLMIDRNVLTGLDIMNPGGLVRLAANDNLFEGDLPAYFEDAKGLQIFNVARNNFTGPIFDISKLRNLSRFDVRNNQLSGPFPQDVSSLSHLTYLYLGSNALSGAFPSTFAPDSLKTCVALPNNVQIVPSETVLNDEKSLAARCGVKSPSPASDDLSARTTNADADVVDSGDGGSEVGSGSGSSLGDVGLSPGGTSSTNTTPTDSTASLGPSAAVDDAIGKSFPRGGGAAAAGTGAGAGAGDGRLASSGSTRIVVDARLVQFTSGAILGGIFLFGLLL